VSIRLTVRRFLCDAAACPRRTFAEQVPGLTTPHARYSPPMRAALTAIAVALAGRAGSRLAAALGIRAGRDTLLNLLRGLPDPPQGTVDVLGIDDFARRRGHVYGTVLLDMRTHRPIDVLPGRDGDPVADWLREHPGVQIVCRDRAGAYADGARTGAPQALQVADRWHVWHNLGEAVDKTVAAHHACVRAAVQAMDPSAEAPPPAPPSPQPALEANVELGGQPEAAGTRDVCGRERRLVVRTRERYTAVQQLVTKGHSLNRISQQLRLDRGTVRRFAEATCVEQLLVKATNRTGKLDGYTEHLRTRFHAGVTDAVVLHAELRQRGFTGSVQTVRRFLHPLRDTVSSPSRHSHPVPPRPEVPKPRHLTRWLMTDPRHLSEADTERLATALSACPELRATAEHVREFADLMNKHCGERLTDWITRVQADPLPALHSLITGMRRDLDAVIAGLTMPWNSGPVEGAVNRIKTIKRSMYGRASFSLLRKRILLNT